MWIRERSRAPFPDQKTSRHSAESTSETSRPEDSVFTLEQSQAVLYNEVASDTSPTHSRH